MAKKPKAEQAPKAPKPPRKPRNKAPTAAQGDVPTTHNGPAAAAPDEMSPAQRDELTRQHKHSLVSAIETKDRAVASIRNLKKRIRSDLGKNGVKLVEAMIMFDTDDGEKEMRANVSVAFEASRLMGVGLGEQMEMFAAADAGAKKSTPYREGFRVGEAGAPCNAPSQYGGDEMQEWISGHHAGNAVLTRKGIQPLKAVAPEPGARQGSFAERNSASIAEGDKIARGMQPPAPPTQPEAPKD